MTNDDREHDKAPGNPHGENDAGKGDGGAHGPREGSVEWHLQQIQRNNRREN